MQARLSGIADGVVPGLLELSKVVERLGLPGVLGELVSLRASQINGCAVCVDMHSRDLKKRGETDERLWAVASWRDAPYFTEQERAALALTEAGTRISDREDPVPDSVWDEAVKHFTEDELQALVLQIGLINTWNRLNVITKRVPGQW